jgi:hypothetical protein
MSAPNVAPHGYAHYCDSSNVHICAKGHFQNAFPAHCFLLQIKKMWQEVILRDDNGPLHRVPIQKHQLGYLKWTIPKDLLKHFEPIKGKIPFSRTKNAALHAECVDRVVVSPQRAMKGSLVQIKGDSNIYAASDKTISGIVFAVLALFLLVVMNKFSF